MSKVVKFGGSSLASAEQFKKVGNIIRADKERKYVVPSAPGKRFSDDTKVTDMLYACYDLADQARASRQSWMLSKPVIRRSSTDCSWIWILSMSSRLLRRILRQRPAAITRLPVVNI